MKLSTTVMGKKIAFFLSKVLCVLLAIMVLSSHDLYIKMETYFLQPNQEASLALYNGTFERSENIITRDRMLDASIVALGERKAINAGQWTDIDSTITRLPFKTGNSGTYVAGVSTKARNIILAADAFNDYLKHDGILDMLDYRKENNVLDQDAVESYQKHVKAIYQVGDQKTDDWSTVLGYPIEFVPLANPYEKYSGDELPMQLLLDGKPLANELVYADYIPTGHTHGTEEHSHDHDDDQDHDGEGHTHTSGEQYRTNDQGVVNIKLPADGAYFVRSIHMENVTDDEELTHQSKWATLTFEVSHKHDSSTHTHDEHAHEGGIPTWAFAVGSLVLIGLLFFVFRKKD